MSDFKAKMHRIRFRLGLRPRPRYGSLQPSSDHLTGFKGPTSKGKERREWKRDGVGKREGRAGLGKGRRSQPPPFQIPGSATATMAHSQNRFGLSPPNTATIPPWSESLDKPLVVLWASWLKPKTTGGRHGFQWQYIANCHLLQCKEVYNKHHVFVMLLELWLTNMSIQYLERTRIVLQGKSWNLWDKGWHGRAVDQEYVDGTFSCQSKDCPCDWARWRSNRRIHSRERRSARVSCDRSRRHVAIWHDTVDDMTLQTSPLHSSVDGRL